MMNDKSFFASLKMGLDNEMRKNRNLKDIELLKVYDSDINRVQKQRHYKKINKVINAKQAKLTKAKALLESLFAFECLPFEFDETLYNIINEITYYLDNEQVGELQMVIKNVFKEANSDNVTSVNKYINIISELISASGIIDEEIIVLDTEDKWNGFRTYRNILEHLKRSKLCVFNEDINLFSKLDRTKKILCDDELLVVTRNVMDYYTTDRFLLFIKDSYYDIEKTYILSKISTILMEKIPKVLEYLVDLNDPNYDEVIHYFQKLYIVCDLNLQKCEQYFSSIEIAYLNDKIAEYQSEMAKLNLTKNVERN